jgi:putative membrane protein
MNRDQSASTAGRSPSALVQTTAITAVVYGILGYVLSSEPTANLPPIVSRAVAGFPHVIAIINAAALVCLLAGWRAIRARRIMKHRKLMLTSAVLISLFLVLYVARVALMGVKAFTGPPAIRLYVYLPTLAIHITLSILSVPLVVYNLLTGLTRRTGDIGKTAHPRVGRVATLLWPTSLALGIVVYFLLNVLY